MRRAAALLLVVTGCRDLTSVEPDRLPPPVRDIQDEADVSNPRDPCGALAVGPPERLSATDGASTDVRLASLVEPGGERFIAAVWLESPSTEGAFGRLVAQLLTSDGARFGDTISFEVPRPRALDLAPVRFHDAPALLILLAHERGSIAARWIPSQDDLRSIADLPLLASPSVAALPDRVLLVALDPGAGVDEGDRARIFELSPESGVLAEGALDLRARAIVVSTSGTQAWLAWISDDDPPELRGAPLVETDAGWQIGEPASYSTAAPWPLRRAQGAVDLSVTLGSSAQGFGAVAVLRLEDRGWNALAVLGPTREGSTTGAAALGESGGRWGLLRSFLPDEQEAAEVRLDRFRTEVDAVPCSTPGECIRVTTDRTPSEPADVAALPGGWALAWTDEQDGQTDVFTTVATCRETAR